MRAKAVALAICFLLLCSCGYVGPVVPPSPQLPAAITDLSVVEQGNQIRITFSTPTRTTDNLPIKRFSEIDLRIGPVPTPFDYERWSAQAKMLPVEPPEAIDPDDPRSQLMETSVPVSQWLGQRVAIAVRTAVKSKDHYSAWSNIVRLDVITPLEAPTVKLEATAQGVKLSWPAEGQGVHYEIYRRGPADKQPVNIGTAEQHEYVDTTAQFDTHYEYSIIAAHGSAESQPSKSVGLTPLDIFPPSIPAKVTALATPDSIEVSWERSPESDLKGYYIYRSVDGGTFVRQGDLLTLPTYSDHDVEHGKTYRYEISAIDQKNNESGKSSPAEVAF